jgi:ABC-type multidrug transport system ATPase subunit
MIDKTNLSKYLSYYNFDLDTILTEKIINEISPSFKKIFCFTRLLCRDVNLYLIDEPDNHLDSKEIEKIIELIKDLAYHQKTVIIASKSKKILSCCNKVINLNQGRGKMVEEG